MRKGHGQVKTQRPGTFRLTSAKSWSPNWSCENCSNIQQPHKQSELCSPEGHTLTDSTYMRNLQQSNSEAGSRMVVAETRERGKWGTAVCVCVCVCAHTHAQLCPTLCDPMDCRLPGSSVHGVLQARTLEWVAISSSRGSSQPRDWTHVSCISCIGRWILYHFTNWEGCYGELLFNG